MSAKSERRQAQREGGSAGTQSHAREDAADPSLHIVRLEGEMNIYRAAELKQVLLDPIHPGANIEFDLSGVSELDTAGVQLLMLARREAVAHQCELRLTGHSAAVTEVFDLLDLHAYFAATAVARAQA